MHGPVGTVPAVETIVPVMVVPSPMMPEPQIAAVLRTVGRIGPNAAIAAVELYHGKIGTRRTSRAKAEYQKAYRKSQTLHSPPSLL